MAKARKLFDFSRAEIEDEFKASALRVLAGEDMQDPRPAFDEKQAREVAAEAAGGRTFEPYRTTLERHGFRFFPAHKLPKFHGVVRQPEGQWRHDRLGLGFYPSDLPRQFPQGPEQLDTWIKTEKKVRKLVDLRAPAAERAKVLRGRR